MEHHALADVFVHIRREDQPRSAARADIRSAAHAARITGFKFVAFESNDFPYIGFQYLGVREILLEFVVREYEPAFTVYYTDGQGIVAHRIPDGILDFILHTLNKTYQPTFLKGTNNETHYHKERRASLEDIIGGMQRTLVMRREQIASREHKDKARRE
jgi:hypothetical protein